MKLFICIPTYNEALNIGNILKVISSGCELLENEIGVNLNIEIINIDSQSTDQTVDIFMHTIIKYKKRSIVLEGERGKGKNILYFLNIAYLENADYCLTLDADIKSAEPIWIRTMLIPLIKNIADYVTPSYARSRFEGSTTNHFAFPIIFSIYNKYIRQPIAGDFAFNKKYIICAINRNPPKSALLYGIDMFMTIIALENDLRCFKVKLNNKIHNPSFNKMEIMFPQIASTFLEFMTTSRDAQFDITKVKMEINIIESEEFNHKTEAIELFNRNRSVISELVKKGCKFSWLDSKALLDHQNMSIDAMNTDQWVSILSSWINFGKNTISSSRVKHNMSFELLPFFVLRATTFWFWSEIQTPKIIEEEIFSQVKMLNEKLI